LVLSVQVHTESCEHKYKKVIMVNCRSIKWT